MDCQLYRVYSNCIIGWNMWTNVLSTPID